MAFEVERVGDEIRYKGEGMTKWKTVPAVELECIWQVVTTAKRYPKLRRIRGEVRDGVPWITVVQMQGTQLAELMALLPEGESAAEE